MLRELDRWKLLSNDTEIGVTLPKEPDALQRLKELELLENSLFAHLREAAPEADEQEWQLLHLRHLCDSLRRDTNTDLDPGKLTRLLKAFAQPFSEGNDKHSRACFALRPESMEFRQIRLQRSWRQIEEIRSRRMLVAQALVQHFMQLRKGNSALVTAKQGELESALQQDINLANANISDWGKTLSSALLYLDANEVLHLARGKAVFRSAMHIEFDPDAQRRQFSKGDYADLALHYKSKIGQVHIMAEFAKLALQKIKAAMELILDYFRMERAAFIRRYFSDRKDVLEMATTEVAHRRILVDLENPEQQAIVTAPLEGSQLVLAGPGSGKTRVIVHRVAWLLRESMIEPEAIMVLAYNRSAALEIRRRLWQLVGVDAAGVTVQTLHSLAMRITGTSYAIAQERDEPINFDHVIESATLCLQNASTHEEHDQQTSIARDRLLAGLRFVLVDEYQDINDKHYALISALTGRTIASEEDRLSLMVVGDDDQNIYAFGGANIRFIRQFENDYQARCYSLLENYRSSRHIIDSTNSIISVSRDRMKQAQNLRINHARRELPAGSQWTELDPLTQGRVHVLQVPDNPLLEAAIALAEMQRLHSLRSLGDNNRHRHWGSFAVIARQWDDLMPMAAWCRQHAIPAQILGDGLPIPLHSSREGQALLLLLRGEQRSAARKRATLRASTLQRWFQRRHGLLLTDWIQQPILAALAQFISDVSSNVTGFELVISQLIDSLYEYGNGAHNSAMPRHNAPLILTTAHSAKGLEFDHVLILDSGRWSQRSNDERRLFYVAMTRARQTLTLCEAWGSRHAFLRDLHPPPLRTQPQPQVAPQTSVLAVTQAMTIRLDMVALSWPAYFAPSHPIHQAIAALSIGNSLKLRPRSDGHTWELLTPQGVVVGQMAKRFQPPAGRITAVRVAAIQTRRSTVQDSLSHQLKCRQWELVVPEIEFTTDADVLDPVLR